jgi:hypothetical protein
MRNRLAILGGIVLIGFVQLSLTGLVAGQSPKSPDDALKRPFDVWQPEWPTSSRQYLRPLVQLKSRLDTYLASSKWRGEFCQFYGTELSFTGRTREAILYLDEVFPNDEYRPADFGKVYPGGKVPADVLAGYEPEDAVAVITALAKARNVVMINEAHDVPQHRLMTLLLIETLGREGYRYFAAETLDKTDERLQSRGYPTLGTGFYTHDPVYGEVVRRALRLGYKVIPYEHSPAKPAPGEKFDQLKSIEEREETQARNLRNRIFAKDPNAKLLIHAGYGHVSKLPVDWKKDDGTVINIPWMAARFAKLTGIDPLVIDQTFLMEHGHPRHDHPVYRAAIEKGWLRRERPVVLQHAGSKATFVPPEHKGMVDMAVLYPPAQEKQGRPTWLRLVGRRGVTVPNVPAPPKGKMLLLQAFYPTEDAEQAIPADQIAYGTDDPKPVLMLPPGSFRTRVVDADGKLVFEDTVTVK